MLNIEKDFQQSCPNPPVCEPRSACELSVCNPCTPGDTGTSTQPPSQPWVTGHGSHSGTQIALHATCTGAQNEWRDHIQEVEGHSDKGPQRGRKGLCPLREEPRVSRKTSRELQFPSADPSLVFSPHTAQDPRPSATLISL